MKFKIGDRVIVKANSRFEHQRAVGVQVIKFTDSDRDYFYWTDQGMGYNDRDLELIEKRKIEPYKIAKFLNSLNKGE